MLGDWELSEDTMTEIKTKTWTTIGTYSNFKEADAKRNELKEKHEEIKVKRGGKGGEVYRVKVWDTPLPPQQNKKSNRRPQKNVNKKVRK